MTSKKFRESALPLTPFLIPIQLRRIPPSSSTTLRIAKALGRGVASA